MNSFDLFLGAATLSFIILLPLKQMGILTWSFWWITAPLWGGALVVIVLAVGVAIMKVRLSE